MLASPVQVFFSDAPNSDQRLVSSFLAFTSSFAQASTLVMAPTTSSRQFRAISNAGSSSAAPARSIAKAGTMAASYRHPGDPRLARARFDYAHHEIHAAEHGALQKLLALSKRPLFILNESLTRAWYRLPRRGRGLSGSKHHAPRDADACRTGR